MSAPFDPYHKWLAIPPADQPPDHYRLLGLSAHEEEADVITGAASRQVAHLRSLDANGRESERSQLIAQIRVAYACLQNSEHKALYDQRLKQSRLRLDRPATGPTLVEATRQTNAATVTPVVPVIRHRSGTTQAGRRLRKNPRRRQILNSLFMLSSAPAGLLFGYWVLCNVSPQFRLSNLLSAPTQSAPRQLTMPALTSPVKRATKPRSQPSQARPTAPLAAGVKPQPPLRPVDLPGPLTRVARAVNLPDVQDLQTITLGPVDLPDENRILLELADPFRATGGDLDGPNPTPMFTIEPHSQPNVFKVVLRPAGDDSGFARPNDEREQSDASIAYFGIKENELSFRWSPAATSSSCRRLRNCMLIVRADAEQVPQVRHVALRRPVRLPPLPITLNGRGGRTEFPVRDFPRDTALRMEIREFEGLHSINGEKTDKAHLQPRQREYVDFDASLQLAVFWVLKEDFLEISASLTYKLEDDIRRALELDSLRRLKDETRYKGLDAIEELEEREGSVASGLASDLRQSLRVRTPGGLLNAVHLWNKGVAVNSTQRGIGANNRRIDKLYRLIPTLQQRYQQIVAMESIAIELQKEARLYFRVFGEFQGETVDIVVTDDDLRPDELLVDDVLGLEPLRGMNDLHKDIAAE